MYYSVFHYIEEQTETQIRKLSQCYTVLLSKELTKVLQEFRKKSVMACDRRGSHPRPFRMLESGSRLMGRQAAGVQSWGMGELEFIS